MKILQHVLVAGLTVAIAAGSSRADVVASAETKHATIPEPNQGDIRAVPAACGPFLTTPAGSTSELLAWDQRLSLAACLENTTDPPPPAREPEQLRALLGYLDDSVKQSRAIYRDAMAHGPTQIQVLAAFKLGMTSVNIMVRARNAIPASSDLDKHLALHRALEPLLASYAREATSAFTEADRLATRAPADAAASAVMKAIVASARSQLHAT